MGVVYPVYAHYTITVIKSFGKLKNPYFILYFKGECDMVISMREHII